jgi:hypothetical protein
MSELAEQMAQKTTRQSFNSLPVSKLSQNSLPAHGRKSTQRMSRPRIGQLLLEAGVVKPNCLHQALCMAKEAKQPVGRMLIGLGFLTERDLQAALLVQSLIAEGAVTERSAIRAIREVSLRKVDVGAVLKELEDQNMTVEDNGGLGSLLVSAGVITERMLEECIEKSMTSGLLLGRMLLLMQGITAPMLQAALAILVMERDGQLDRDESVRVLREIRRNCSMEEALSNCRIKLAAPKSSLKIGELLALSKFITETESAIAVERALQEKRLVGEILVSSGAVPDTVLTDALALQTMVCRGVLSVTQSAEILQRAHNEHKTIRQVSEEMQVFNCQSALLEKALQLLKQAGIISDAVIAMSISECQQYKMSPCNALLASGSLQSAVLNAAVQCVEMIERSMLRADEAVTAIGICERSRTDLNTTLAGMGIATEITTSKPSAPPVNNGVSTLLDWASYPQFQQTIALILLVISSDFAVYRFANSYLSMAMWVSMVVLGAGMMNLGFGWRKHRDNRDDARALHLTTARQTKARLEQRSR